MSQVSFFNEDVSFQLSNEQAVKNWVLETATKAGYQVEEINYIFCSDEYLLKMNREYLNHDYYTDIITFNNSVQPNEILSDIFISINRVQENADDLGINFHTELLRVIIHGVLHLIGYSDKTEDEQAVMRKKEDACLLSLLNLE